MSHATTAPEHTELSFRAAARSVGVHYMTLRRWATDGTKTPAGVIQLKTRRKGARRYTTPAWLAEYQAAVDAGFSDPRPEVERAAADSTLARDLEATFGK